jgi:hypothetical protein
MQNVDKTIISQYANSPTLKALIYNFNQYIDPLTDFDNFYNYVWNVETAQGFGLDIWGRIVNVGRVLKIPNAPNYLGFSQATPGAQPFGQAPFYSGASSTSNFALSDPAYRTLIMVKALANISRTTAPAINQLLSNLFAGRGRVYVNDLGGMKFRYTFEFLLTAYEYAIVTQSGALPIPGGVEVSLLNSSLPVFGFKEMGAGAAPFGQAPFLAASATASIN